MNVEQELQKLQRERAELKKRILHEVTEAMICLQSPANLEMLQNRLENIYDAIVK